MTEHDLGYISDSLAFCLKQLLEYNHIDGIFAQKYIIDHEIFWDVTLDDAREGVRILGAEDEDLEMHRALLETALTQSPVYILERLENRIIDEWNDHDTIMVDNASKRDDYFLNGVSRRDFFEYGEDR